MKTLSLLAAAVITGQLASSFGARASSEAAPAVVISSKSIRINGIELRTADYGYISLASAKRALGPPTDQYSWGAPIYVWRPVGIALQTGWRGDEKGRIFKLHVYFEDSYDPKTELKSGNFRGQLRVEGLAVTAETEFESIRADLTNDGFAVTDGQATFAKKSGIEIFKSETTGKVARVDVWCPYKGPNRAMQMQPAPNSELR